MENFKTELTAGNVKAAMKEVGAVSADLWQVEPSQLRIIEGFNVRVVNEDYVARVRRIADSIRENGYYKDKPLSGFVSRDGIYITGGHTRHAAVLLAISEGVDIQSVPVIVSPKGTAMEDLTVALVVGNEGTPLTLYESAIVCKRLVGYGYESKDIARRLGYASTQYVDGLLSLAAAPLALRKMVMENVIAASTAIDAIAKHGGEATDVLLAALVASGSTRVTAKNLPQNAFKLACKKEAEPMHTALTKVTVDPAFGLLSDEVRTAIIELIEGMPKP